jgi:hypothetical protein
MEPYASLVAPLATRGAQGRLARASCPDVGRARALPRIGHCVGPESARYAEAAANLDLQGEFVTNPGVFGFSTALISPGQTHRSVLVEHGRAISAVTLFAIFQNLSTMRARTHARDQARVSRRHRNLAEAGHLGCRSAEPESERSRDFLRFLGLTALEPRTQWLCDVIVDSRAGYWCERCSGLDQLSLLLVRFE